MVTIAMALIQCVTRTQTGWMTCGLAGADAGAEASAIAALSSACTVMTIHPSGFARRAGPAERAQPPLILLLHLVLLHAIAALGHGIGLLHVVFLHAVLGHGRTALVLGERGGCQCQRSTHGHGRKRKQETRTRLHGWIPPEDMIDGDEHRHRLYFEGTAGRITSRTKT